MDAELEKTQRIHQLQADLVALEELQSCEGYRRILLPKLVEAEKVHLEGVTSRKGNRDLHVEAWHLAVELKDFIARKLDAINKELREACGDDVPSEVDNG